MIQKIPEKYGNYIAGLTDGEGSFNVSFRQRDDFLIGWKITPVFNISQDEREILAWIKHILKCGTLRFRKDGVWAFEVSNFYSLNENILPFFRQFPLRSKKKRLQYQKFQKICILLQKTSSMTYDILKQILVLRNESYSIKSPKRRYTDTFILQRAESYWNKNKIIIENKNRKA